MEQCFNESSMEQRSNRHLFKLQPGLPCLPNLAQILAWRLFGWSVAMFSLFGRTFLWEMLGLNWTNFLGFWLTSTRNIRTFLVLSWSTWMALARWFRRLSLCDVEGGLLCLSWSLRDMNFGEILWTYFSVMYLYVNRNKTLRSWEF